MGRTLTSGERDWGLWLLLLVAAAACHLSWQITPNIGFDLRPIACLIAIYAGYKFGRWPGAALGALSTLALLAWTFLGDEPASVQQGLLGPLSRYFGQGFALTGFSMQDAAMAAAAGFLGGWAFDRIEGFLGRPLSSLLTGASRVGPLQRAYEAIGRILWPDPDAAKPIGATTWQMLLTPAVLALLTLLNFTLSATSDALTFRIFPPLLAASVVAVIAWRGGFSRAVAATLWLAASSWVAYATLADLGQDELENVQLWPSIQGPAHLVGLLVVAWWLAQASATILDADLQAYWRGIWARLTHPELGTRRPSVALWIALFPLAIGFEIALGPLRLGYVPVLGLFLVLSWMAARYGAVAVSRQAFWTLLVLGVVAVAGKPFDATPSLSLQTFSANAVDLVLLAAVPLVAARLDLSRIDVSRMLCFGFLAVWTVTNALIGGWVPDDLSVVTLRVEVENSSSPLPLIRLVSDAAWHSKLVHGCSLGRPNSLLKGTRHSPKNRPQQRRQCRYAGAAEHLVGRIARVAIAVRHRHTASRPAQHRRVVDAVADREHRVRFDTQVLREQRQRIAFARLPRVRGGDRWKVQQIDAVAIPRVEFLMDAVGVLGGADDVDAGRNDTRAMRVDAILRYDARYATVKGGCIVGTRDEIAHRVEPRVRPVVFERVRDELLRDIGIDRIAMHQTAIQPMDARALLADQRAVEPQMIRNPRRARIHAPTRQHHRDTRLDQARDRIGYFGIRERFMARARRDQRAVDVERDELDVLHALTARCRALLLLRIAQIPSAHLARHRHREFVDELDLARVFVRRELLLHVLLDLADQRVGFLDAGHDLDERFDRLPALRIGHADHRARCDTLHLDDLRFDLGGTDAVARRLDDVVAAALEVEVAVVVGITHVAGHAPLAFELLFHRFRILPILAHHHRALAADRDLADFAVRDRLDLAASTTCTRCPGYAFPSASSVYGSSAPQVPMK